MRFGNLVEISNAVAATRSRKTKISLLADCLRALSKTEAPITVAYLASELPQGRFGVDNAGLRLAAGSAANADAAPAARPLSIRDVHQAVEAGVGSQSRCAALLEQLFSRATSAEGSFLRALLMGELRQGALQGVMSDTLARATETPVAVVRKAAMLTGSLVTAGARLLAEGQKSLAALRLAVLQPLQPMLAQSADSVGAALARTGRASVAPKLDGA